MTSSSILSVTTFVYGLAFVLYVSSWIFKKDAAGKAASWVFLIAAVGNAIGFFLRWNESYQLGFGHIPLSNLYESLVFFAFTIAIISFIIERKYKNISLGIFASPVAFLAIAYASLSPHIPDHIQPLLPALKSNWLIAHVITCFLGYSAFAISFVMSIMYLLVSNEDSSGDVEKKSFLPSHHVLDELSYKMVMFGFFFLTIGIITGAVWANSAWGRYWGWDPKETWSLITWLIYAAYLHAKLMIGWKGKRMAIVSIIGFLAVLFTYFGVNYLPGLHSYGAMG